MGNSPKKPEVPPPTVQGILYPDITRVSPRQLELVKGFTKQIRKMRNEFTRTTNQLKMNNTKINNEIKRMLARNEPRVKQSFIG